MFLGSVLPLVCHAAEPIDIGFRRAADVPGVTTYRVTLTVTSDLPSGNVPMDPTVDFGKLIADATLSGVLDPNSITVVNKATGQPVPFSRNEDFAYGDRGRLEWVITDPAHKTFEICFRTARKRPPLEPQVYTPPVGVGDLLRYNAGRPQPITLFYSAALADLTGDGEQDLVGCWNYAYRPGEPWSGIICYPRVEDSGSPEFGDLVRLRYAKTPDATALHKFGGGPYVTCALADFNTDGNTDLVYTGSGKATFYLNTGRRDLGGMPIFAPSQSMKVSAWNASQVVDLDGDGALDFVVDGKYIRNQNSDGWPFKAAKEVALDAGNQPCFLDVDYDGRLDAVTLEDAPGEGLSNYQVVWRRNLGKAVPSFAPAEALTDIDSQITRPRGLAAVRSRSGTRTSARSSSRSSANAVRFSATASRILRSCEPYRPNERTIRNPATASILTKRNGLSCGARGPRWPTSTATDSWIWSRTTATRAAPLCSRNTAIPKASSACARTAS
jgi:hypothetical protein